MITAEQIAAKEAAREAEQAAAQVAGAAKATEILAKETAGKARSQSWGA